jgi:hypothetical protein
MSKAPLIQGAGAPEPAAGHDDGGKRRRESTLIPIYAPLARPYTKRSIARHGGLPGNPMPGMLADLDWRLILAVNCNIMRTAKARHAVHFFAMPVRTIGNCTNSSK